MYPFTNNSSQIKTAYKIDIPLEIQHPPEFTQDPITLGDHLRRRRLELGLYQKDVALQIGVTASTIWNWENGVVQASQGAVFGTTWCQMDRDPEQLGDWLSRRHSPCRRNREKVECFLNDRIEKMVSSSRANG